MNPDLRILGERAALLRAVRDFFHGEGFLEVDTPALAPSILPEPAIDVFTLCAEGQRKRYLLPSPERWMKRLVAMGAGRIYQLSHVFRRNEPPSGVHASEFMMLEWYASDSDYLNELERTKRLLRAVASAESPFAKPPAELTIAEAVSRYAGIDLESCVTIDGFRSALLERGVECSGSDTWADLFHRLLVGYVEPGIAPLPSVALIDYPFEVGCLARRRPGSMWRERWELYLGGIEVANCYSEATESRELEEFVERESAAMRKRCERIDTDFARIAAGIATPYSGVALGFDRLFMLLGGYRTIEEAAWFLDELRDG